MRLSIHSPILISCLRMPFLQIKPNKLFNLPPKMFLDRNHSQARFTSHLASYRNPKTKCDLNHKTYFITLLQRTHHQDQWDIFLDNLDPNDKFTLKINLNLQKKTPAIYSLMGLNGPVFSDAKKPNYLQKTSSTNFLQTPVQLSQRRQPTFILSSNNLLQTTSSPHGVVSQSLLSAFQIRKFLILTIYPTQPWRAYHNENSFFSQPPL